MFASPSRYWSAAMKPSYDDNQLDKRLVQCIGCGHWYWIKAPREMCFACQEKAGKEAREVEP